MTALIVLAVLVLACLVVFGLITSEKRNRLLAEYVGEEHQRNLEVCRQLVTMTETWGAEISRAALRETEDTRQVLQALASERRLFVNAVLASSADPRAVQRLGLVEQAASREERSLSLREELAFLRDDDPYARESETTGPNGEVIVPVGMTGN